MYDIPWNPGWFIGIFIIIILTIIMIMNYDYYYYDHITG